uniref:DNA polymerase family B elongation subunit n=1 Tax=Mimivirus LCMiAC02 TaxID=2506609 RepID=A0A481Z1G0_9VIRU|nr:MAG: DNA polymerase family B elongation subunit [Mimivirus LCMiAC02]
MSNKTKTKTKKEKEEEKSEEKKKKEIYDRLIEWADRIGLPTVGSNDIDIDISDNIDNIDKSVKNEMNYESLYPRSLIHRNISHECLVSDKEYDNLPGVHYYEISFYNKDENDSDDSYDNDNRILK